MKRSQLYLSTIDAEAPTLAKRHGLGLEIAEYCTAMNMDEGFARTDESVRKALSHTDRAILHGPFNELFPCAIDPSARRLAAYRYRRAMEIAAGYDIHKLVLHGGFLPNVYYPIWFVNESIVFWRAFLREMPEDATICLENVLEDTPGMLRDIVAGVEDRRLRLCLDIGHANVYSKIPADRWIRECAPYLEHMHFHNNMGDRDSHGALMNGTMDIARLLDTADEVCPGATCTLELPEARESVAWLEENGSIR